jgi:hypothetical protein
MLSDFAASEDWIVMQLCMFSGFVAREDGIAVHALLTLAVIRSNISGHPLQHSMLSSAPT